MPEVAELIKIIKEMMWIVAILVVCGIVARIIYPPLAIVFWVMLGIYLLYKALTIGEMIYKPTPTTKTKMLMGEIEAEKIKIKTEYLILIAVIVVALIFGLYIAYTEMSIALKLFRGV